MTKQEDEAKQALWLAEWMRAAGAEGAMSQRKASSVARLGGGLDAAIEAAKAAGIHLVLLTDDRGVELVAASPHPFKTLC